MKRKLFYFAVSALALTACTSENVVEDKVRDSKAIGFDNVVNKLTRDVSDLTYNSLTQFNVFGFYTTPGNANVAVEEFTNVPVYRQSGGTWSYILDGEGNRTTQPEKFWMPDARYYFYAYSCGNELLPDTQFSFNTSDALSASGRTLKINNYLCDATHQHDLIYATNTGAVEGNKFAGILGLATGNDLVTFQFTHLLSKVSAKFTSNMTSDYTIEISNVSIENIRNIGDYNPETGWQNVLRTENGSAHVFLLNTSDPDISPIQTGAGQADAVSQSAYVIPWGYDGQESADATKSTWVNIKFTATLYNKSEKILVQELTGKFNPTWLAGYSYVYNVQLDGSALGLKAIAFTTATDKDGNVITDWTNGTGSIEIK